MYQAPGNLRWHWEFFVCGEFPVLSGGAAHLYPQTITQAERAQVDEVLYVPAALVLRQRPGIPGIRSTFDTGT